MAPSADLRPRRLTVWYDGDCPICAREIAMCRRLDRARRIDFVDLSIGDDCPRDRVEMLSRLHAQRGDGPLLRGVEAFIALWRELPGGRALAAVSAWPPVTRALALAYEAFLRVRPTLQRLALRLLGPARPAPR